MRAYGRLAFGLLCSLLAGHSHAQIQVEDHEMLMLPEYCRHAQTFKTRTAEGVAAWGAKIGPAFPHIHHYCWALVNIARAKKFGVPEHHQRSMYASAIGDIDYVLERAGQDFVLLPEVLTRRGEALVELKKYVDAEATFKRAISAKSDYWPAYKGLAEMHLTKSDKTMARKTLEEGIKRSSDPRMLQRMLKDIRSQGGS